MVQDILVLGASGDIGTQALDLLRYSFDYRVLGLSLHSRIERIEPFLFYFDQLKYIAIEDENKAEEFKKRHPLARYEIIKGPLASLKMLQREQEATVLNAISGNDGLLPTLTALKQNQDLLLANKESLVIGYELIKPLLKGYRGSLFPIDSEHVALSKVLKEVKGKRIDSYFITASGGSLRDYKREEFASLTPKDVLKHPTWNMSKKITIDCATLVNKAYEVIEAKNLFQLEQVDAYLCRSSLIHAGVFIHEGNERKRITEFSPNDMKISIAYALSKGTLSLHQKDEEEKEKEKENPLLPIDHSFYPLFSLTLRFYEKYNGAGMIYYNAVDSVVIEQFLQEKVSFLDIEQALSYTYSHLPSLLPLSEETLPKLLDESKHFASSLIEKKPWR